jgi:HAD superfamily phosphoserine phosphatase-like hydrolase
MTRGVAVFDLDGTLLRGDTVCEVLARPLGRLEEMRRFERLKTEASIMDARAHMVGWYRARTTRALEAYLSEAHWAPGAYEAIQQLQKAGIVVGIASITWKFAVRWFAERLDISHHLGTDVRASGEIVHVWGRDKARWLKDLSVSHDVGRERTAAIGDSPGDAEMLAEAGLRFYVGADPVPEVTGLIHLPGADLRRVSERIVEAWGA